MTININFINNNYYQIKQVDEKNYNNYKCSLIYQNKMFFK